METIKIEFQPNIKDKLMEFLNSFKFDEVHIVEDESYVVKDDAYWEYSKKLHLEAEKIESGESKLYDIDELDAMLDEVISKYES